MTENNFKYKSVKDLFESYISSISKKFAYDETSEMGYRKEFEILIETIFETINVKRIDHDAKARGGNKPDFIVLKHDLPILYIETKTIGVSLDKVEKSEQMARYFGYSNLVLTDYVEFRFYRNGERYEGPIIIAEYNSINKTISANPENYEHLAKSLIDFAQTHKEPIKNGLHLAKIMGGKAQRIRDNLLQFLTLDSEKNSEIIKIYDTIKNLLVHDLKPDSFADMYAQTLVYGLFVARYHDETPDNFSRQEARELVPSSNPFLRHFFDHIAGVDFDKRLKFLVDELCEVFSHANIPLLMKQYFKDDLWGKTHEGPDPVIHFYEDFLREYDAELRKKMGAYYTPQPVVRFIVSSVDYLLKNEFGLPSGLADSAKLENGKHKVQILDPAVGTGTFLSAVIRNIYLQLKENGQIGRWPTYVHNDLLPRIHGFEIMMAPYTIAHLKLSMAFKATGFKHFNRRLGIYLTNSLEEADNIGNLFSGLGFANSIAEESKEASQIKNDSPIMVVIGNPPYSVSSSNKGNWIKDLISCYKTNLNERNIQPLSDDYIKFIRYAEHFVEKNKTGIVAMITNNSFLDGIIHRQMRKHLLETFDEIYILDLHGNSKRKETAPDGSKDENIFNIMQGVAISIMVKKNVEVSQPPQKNLGIVKFAELYGKRSKKFISLSENELDTIKWEELKNIEPNYFFSHKDFSSKTEYEEGFKIDNLFVINSSGVKTHRDSFIVSFSQKELSDKLNNFISEKSDSSIMNDYSIKDSRDWSLTNARKELKKTGWENFIRNYSYRPFDKRIICYSINLIDKGTSRINLMRNFFTPNIALTTIRTDSNFIGFNSISVTRDVSDIHYTGGQTYIFPLYTFSENGTKTPNLNTEITETIEKTVGKTEPEEILDYIYAVLHSPSYRNKYKEFLKIDFPRVPYAKDKNTFNTLVKLGTELRLLHLLESPKVGNFITTYPIIGDDEITRRLNKNDFEISNKVANLRGFENLEGFKVGKVWINETQYFGNVPEIAWNFYIGGYQPAQKWLKDRKGRTLTNQEIEHYQKIIVSLIETDRIMKEIDGIKFF